MKQLTVAVHYEERRRHYLSQQAKIMLGVHDEVAAMPEEDSNESPFSMILKRSSLAEDLKSMFESLCDNGVVKLLVNNFILVSFCLPHKIHRQPWASRNLYIEPGRIQRCLERLRPYHGILLLTDKHSLQEFLPLDGTQSLNRLITVTNPLKSLQTLALEADLNLSQVFQMVSHLVYWAKATVIFPVCGTNVYVLSPTVVLNSGLNEKFAATFQEKSLSVELSKFSYPVQLRDTRDILDHPKNQEEKVQIVLWLLQHRLIFQQHTYIFFVPPLSRRKKKTSEDVSRIMPILPEDESLAFENRTEMQRASSISDVASVNSDESVSIGSNSINAMFSKSPSSEIASDSSQVSEDMRAGNRFNQDGLSHLSKEERECVLNVPAAKSPEDLKLFSRLCSYFNGKHHIEEIMYYENLHRAHLVTLLDKFRDVLIMCQYQDPATALGIR
ncbi:Nitrogen permease regulator 3-like protein [Mizuhopecten yessoensis]|uniref:GATOR complex protein NPRL3 n=3 Tax=Mizuhopecten yessoensis TaxID=6573 RepID=A0A210PSB8_MIZYE|nr:Nitrogen permease regulator 3-like protein [Mizuhopecten yessoensis]